MLATTMTRPQNNPSATQFMKLGEILLRKRWITSQQLEEAIAQQTYFRLKLGELLVMKGLLAPPQVEEALQEQMWRKQGFWII